MAENVGPKREITLEKETEGVWSQELGFTQHISRREGKVCVSVELMFE